MQYYYTTDQDEIDEIINEASNDAAGTTVTITIGDDLLGTSTKTIDYTTLVESDS